MYSNSILQRDIGDPNLTETHFYLNLQIIHGPVDKEKKITCVDLICFNFPVFRDEKAIWPGSR